MHFIFEVVVKEGYTAQQYAAAWVRASELIQQAPGARGTRLHRKLDDPRVLLAIATWESKAARDAMEAAQSQRIRDIVASQAEFVEIRVIGEFDDPQWLVLPESTAAPGAHLGNADRVVDLPGAVNLRDFGGHLTADGRRVRTGLLYRSGTLAHLSQVGQQQFMALDVQLICDLRRSGERDNEPTPFTLGTPNRLEIAMDPGSAVLLREGLADGGLSLTERIALMVGINRDLVRDHARDYARMFAALLDLEDGSFLVHCSAGKDRTGLACALILHALGVPEETVIDDYLFTNDAIDFEGYMLPRLVAQYEDDPLPDREAIMALAGVRREYLQAAFDVMREEFEGIERYVESAIGLDIEDRERLRERFLEP